MANKTYDVRILLKNASDSSWAAVQESFVPMQGEVVLYEAGKYKIGNGTTILKDLPFYYGDKDTDTKYEFSVDPNKPSTLIITAKDKDGNALAQPQEVVIPGGADLAPIEKRLSDAEEAIANLASLKPLNYRGIHDVVESDGAISVADITDAKEADVVLDVNSGKEYVYDGSAWREIGDENSYLTEARADEKYVAKEEGKGLSHNDLTDAYKAAIDAALEKLAGIEDGANKTNISISGLSESGQNVATITINGTDYVIKAPLADEVNVPAYISDLSASAPANSGIEVVFSCGGAPQA